MRNRFLSAEMINIQAEMLQPFLTFQAEVKKTQREMNSFFLSIEMISGEIDFYQQK